MISYNLTVDLVTANKIHGQIHILPTLNYLECNVAGRGKPQSLPQTDMSNGYKPDFFIRKVFFSLISPLYATK